MPKEILKKTPKKIAAAKPEVMPIKAASKAIEKLTSSAVSTLSEKNQKTKSINKASFSSFNRLSNLRKKLDNQQRDQAFAASTQQRSTSIMHADPFPVPKTIVPLTRDQKHKLNTVTTHTGTITKNDNGTCTIQRAQVYGSPIPASTSYFACGENKFDKSFRLHMDKVQAKLAVPSK